MGVVHNERILYSGLLDPRMVDSDILFTKCESEWAKSIRAISLYESERWCHNSTAY